jgi:hypothetical protein
MTFYLLFVVPAEAGTQNRKFLYTASLGPRFRGGDGIGEIR